MTAPFVRIVAQNGKAYPLVGAVSPLLAAPASPITAVTPLDGNTGAAVGFTPVAAVAPTSCGEAQHELQSRAESGLPGAMGGKIPTASPAPYQARTSDCPDCEYPGQRCDICWSTGEIDAVCVECDRDEPLNSEGVCEKCHDMGELPSAEYYAKHLSGWALAEKAAHTFIALMALPAVYLWVTL